MPLKDRINELRDARAADRRNYQPSGTPLRIYQSWLRNGGVAPYRENFCHYWRVVVFWGLTLLGAKLFRRPPRRLNKTLVIGFSVALGLAIAGMIFVPAATLRVIAIAASCAYAYVGVEWLIVLNSRIHARHRREWDENILWQEPWFDRHRKIHLMLTPLMTPLLALFFVLAVFAMICRFLRWSVHSHPRHAVWVRPIFLIVPVALGPLLALPATRWATLQVLKNVGAFVLFSCIVLAGLRAVLVAYEFLKTRIRARREAVAMEPALELSPRNPPKFWRAIKAALTVVKEFGGLLWAIIVTRKWQICPLVELPKVEQNT